MTTKQQAEPFFWQGNPYQLLDRMREDCEYYINYSHHPKYLWTGEEYTQIERMIDLWNFTKEKPEWISVEEIMDYAKKMGCNFIWTIQNNYVHLQRN